jgi:hypothetical protein
MDPASRNAIVALEAAMADAAITPEQVAADPYGFAVVLGTTRGPATTRKKAYEQLRAREGKMLSSTLFSNCGYNIAAAMAAMAHGIKGPNLTVAARCNLSIQLFRRAWQLLVARRVHTVFTGFSECLLQKDESPPHPREWACIFVLERAERARQRGATSDVAVVETELESPERQAGFFPERAFRLSLPLPQPFSPAALTDAKPVELNLSNPLEIDSEYLPLIQAARLRAAPYLEENTYVGFPVPTRTGFSVLGVARV